MSEDNLSESGSFKFPDRIRVACQGILGNRRTFVGLGLLEWTFLVVSTINIVATIAITMERILTYAKIPGNSDFTFALLLLITTVFCLFYVYNGLLGEQMFEIIAFIGSEILVLAYCIFEYSFNIEGRNTNKLIRVIGSCVLAPPNIYLAVKVAQRFGWLEFRIVGASEALQQIYRQQRAFLSLQRFDLQAAISFVILVLENGMHIGLKETLTLVIGIIFSFIWLLLGSIAVTKEIKMLIWIYAILGIIEPIYIVAKIVLTLTLHVSSSNHISSLIFYTLLGVGTVALIVRLALLLYIVVVRRNFNCGLSDRAFQDLISPETKALLPGRPRRRSPFSM